MGCVRTKDRQERRLPDIPCMDKFREILQIDNRLNVNKKYEYLVRLIPGQTVGEGIRKTCAYECLTIRKELHEKRREFWETRTTGNSGSWDSIRRAIECEEKEIAMEILRESGLTLVDSSIQMCIDLKLGRYQVPVFCINDPSKYSSVDLAHLHLKKEFKPENVEIKVRSAGREDQTLSLSNSKKIDQVKKIYLKKLQKDNARLFCKGRELMDDSSLGSYKIQTGDVIQAMVI